MTQDVNCRAGVAPRSGSEGPAPQVVPSNGRRALRAVVCAVLVASFALGHATAAVARDFLWKATGKSGIVYVVGSIHLLTEDFYPLSPPL